MLVTLQPDGFALVYEDDNPTTLRVELIEVHRNTELVQTVRTIMAEPWYIQDTGPAAVEALVDALTWLASSLSNDFGTAWLQEPIGG